MARYAMVHEASGFIANVVEWDGDTATWQPPQGYVMIEDAAAVACPGGMYVGGEFQPPPGGLPGS